MCLIVVGWRVHPDFPLVVAANRDEFLARPAQPAHWWSDAPDLLAGRDLEGGGTWMGLTRQGRFAALTNYRDPARHRPGAPSRGMLVRGCLTSDATPQEALREVAKRSADHVAFNLLVSDGADLAIHESTNGSVRTLDAGIHGLSNHLLNTPWPKVERACRRFAEALRRLPDEGAFLELLRDPTRAPDKHLPETGVSLEWERALSPAFIRAPGYGTRCSTLILVGRDGNVVLHEWTWDTEGQCDREVRHRFLAAGGWRR